ncbi:hypothetical protein FisN_19Lh033 [Fistulifera solaris]|uniref:Arrestin C-terminal-like domain-containing protein n=1 Tax=Fistulifera solaris TaxID=1519565 RepID=A0A1Z5JRD1_FISSO|nr:hypothetical protein FisN_19Lh033 [Fistulifera solaris]|eukprot:GAX16456.1 hypothetical protein FisN_19Lh033 [Fistulifera solaris]
MRPLIRFDLERPNGAYFAGEVVRGTVTVKASGLKCKGAFVTFEASSRVKWYEDSGDDRQEFKAKTILQVQCETLYAPFSRTAFLEDAGRDAYFDKVPNSGILRIPCDLSEEHHFPLVVRVNGRDRGTQDMILGEMLLDVPNLVSLGTKETFELTKNGRNKNGYASITLSARILPYNEVYPMQERARYPIKSQDIPISSLLLKPLCLVLQVHEATGLSKAWLTHNDVCVKAYRIAKAVTPGKMIHLPDEAVTTPFAFALRADAPGSAEFPLLSPHKCQVRYTLQTRIYTTHWRDPIAEIIINVTPRLPRPQVSLWMPAQIETLDQPIYNYCYCGWYCCKSSGLISSKLHLERLVYAPDEAVHMTGEVVNDSDKPLPFFVVLTQLVFCMKSMGGTNFRHFTLPCYFDLFQSTIPAQSTVSIQDLDGIEQVRIPSVFPSFNGGVPQPFTENAYPCLRWSYTLEIRVGKSRDFVNTKKSVFCRVPILISQAPRNPERMEAVPGVSPIAMANSLTFLETYGVNASEEEKEE